MNEASAKTEQRGRGKPLGSRVVTTKRDPVFLAVADRSHRLPPAAARPREHDLDLLDDVGQRRARLLPCGERIERGALDQAPPVMRAGLGAIEDIDRHQLATDADREPDRMGGVRQSHRHRFDLGCALRERV